MRTTIGMAAIASGSAICVTGLTLASAQVALAPPERFGERGQYVVTSELAFDYQRDTTHTPGEDDVTRTSYDFHVGFDRIMMPPLTLGARVGFDGFEEGFDSRKRFDIGLRLGGLLRLGGGTRWWPTVGFDYGLTSYSDRSSASTVRTFTIVAAAPFLWEPIHHVLLGIGPTYARDLQSKTGPDADQQAPGRSGFGIHGLIGYWF